jgi:hypothetical protein
MRKNKGSSMNLWGIGVPLLLLALLVWLAYAKKGGAAVREGFSKSGALIVSVAPSMALGFFLAGFVTALVPRKRSHDSSDPLRSVDSFRRALWVVIRG